MIVIPDFSQPRQYPDLFGLGADTAAAINTPIDNSVRVWSWVALASSVLSTYHGYKRNQSIGWALAWGALGAAFPIIVPTVAVAQGFGKKK